MISFESKGSFQNTERFLNRMSKGEIYNTLSKYGQMGVDALANATPVDTAYTAQSWYYEIVKDGRYWGIIWYNRNVINGRPIAVLLQYGHATRTGGYVQGIDYINPAIKPIFDQIANDAWKEVTRK